MITHNFLTKLQNISVQLSKININGELPIKLNKTYITTIYVISHKLNAIFLNSIKKQNQIINIIIVLTKNSMFI